jgi:photosystem II stability/assembly factor-like uncharacterized protein
VERSAVVTLLAVVSIAAVASCGPAAVTPSPASPGIDWRRSLAVVERPEEAFTPPVPSTLVPRETGLSGHPAHFPGQAVMADVAWTGTEYVSIGYVSPGWTPIAWTSPDGDHWTIQRIGDTEFTFPVGIAVGQSGGVVAVGRSGPRPIAWTSPDGQRWASHGVPTLGTAGVAERMTTIVVTPDGYLAGGSVGPETLERHARYWRSPDGADWTPVADDPTAFADAEVRSIVRNASGYVAVGLLGTAVEPTGSLAWTSADGEHWARVDDPDLAKGRVASLVVRPDGGLLAVGADLDRHGAAIWTSTDGRTWDLAPGEASRRQNGSMRMSDVASVDDRYIAVGDFAVLQYSTMGVWTSTDLAHWTAAADIPAFQGAEPYAIAAGPVGTSGGATTPGLVVVGSFGNPDDYIPTVWVSPAG